MSLKFIFKKVSPAVWVVFGTLFFVSFGNAQNMDFERSRHRSILQEIKNEVKKNYYDANFRGFNIEEKFKASEEKIKQATSIGQMSSIIAQTLLDFDDSHLFFIPPGKVNKTEYGFEMKMVGDRCFVSKVSKKSDAEAQGLKVGDEIFALEGFAPTRENLWKMRYFYWLLRPRPILKLSLIKPDGKELEMEIKAKITEGRRIIGNSMTDWQDFFRTQENEDNERNKQFFYEKANDFLIWRMPSFSSVAPNDVDNIISKAKKKKGLIIDLRGNGGGRVDTLLRLIGNVFLEDVKVGDEKKRKATKELIAKSRGKDNFIGKLIVLIDNQSASASEVFSRVIQIEKRGTIIGDSSAGAVMESISVSKTTGVDIVAFYGVSVTIADLIMKDGKSLEKIGVVPDEKKLPTALDMANNRDPVLSRAIEILGYKITSEEAGKIFPDGDK